MLCSAAGREEAEFAAEKSSVGPSATVLCALRSAGFCQAAPARREDGRTVRKEQQKAVVAEQPVLRAAARLRASTPAMATSSSLGQDNAWLQRGRAASSQSSLQQDPGRQERCGEVSFEIQAGVSLPQSTGELQGDPSEVTSWAAPVCRV